MSSTGSEKPSCPDRIARATGLIRALAGVLDASVEGDDERIRSIVVVADAALSPWEVTRNIQSALLASMGIPIERAVIEVRRGEATAASADAPASAAAPAPSLAGDGSAPTAAGNGTRLVRGDSPGSSAPGSGIGPGRESGIPATRGARLPPGAGPGKPAPAGAGTARPPAFVRAGYSVARLEVDTRRIGRVLCRAVVAGQNRISVGEAEATDTPAGRLEAAARAVLAAAPVTGVDLEGVRALELSGRYYVIVAVRRWTGQAPQYIAEVASVDGSLETAAAHATLGAILR